MYSRLDPIFKTRFRHAETLDTRQGIRRHDQPGRRGKQHEREEDTENKEAWEDSTSIAVQTLKVFLEQLAQETAGPQSNADHGEKIDLSPRAEQGADRHQKSADPAAQQAAQAYQRTYRATHDEARVIPNRDAIPDIALTPAEIRIIHRLIKDLDRLAARNIEQLTILKSESFLQSLVDAVEKLK